MGRKVIKIEALSPLFYNSELVQKKRRVAAYARVSTSSLEQLNSIEAQKDYYTNYILGHPNWEFAGVYIDEGISGTSSKNRDGFNQMIDDAIEGKIDMIVTKSISRFARNTVDTLTFIRKLKDVGVEVFFEKENIYSFDSKGEFMLTLLSSMAQEESRSLSENVIWGQRKRMADGKYSLPYSQFLGYKKGEDGKPEIVESEAAIVRRIFRLYLEGKTTSNIANLLSREGIVNAANTNLQMGGGVCGAIFKEAGVQELQDACDKLAPIKTGEAVVTPGFAIPAKYIIHTAGPVYHQYNAEKSEECLRSAYINSLLIASEYKCESILTSETDKLSDLANKTAKALSNLDWAKTEINNLININRGGETGVHGFISEFAETGIRNARDVFQGLRKSVVLLNDNGPADILLQGKEVQIKFYANILKEISCCRILQND